MELPVGGLRGGKRGRDGDDGAHGFMEKTAVPSVISFTAVRPVVRCASDDVFHGLSVFHTSTIVAVALGVGLGGVLHTYPEYLLSMPTHFRLVSLNPDVLRRYAISGALALLFNVPSSTLVTALSQYAP